jgi:hypothetical protein
MYPFVLYKDYSLKLVSRAKTSKEKEWREYYACYSFYSQHALKLIGSNQTLTEIPPEN